MKRKGWSQVQNLIINPTYKTIYLYLFLFSFLKANRRNQKRPRHPASGIRRYLKSRLFIDGTQTKLISILSPTTDRTKITRACWNILHQQLNSNSYLNYSPTPLILQAPPSQSSHAQPLLYNNDQEAQY